MKTRFKLLPFLALFLVQDTLHAQNDFQLDFSGNYVSIGTGDIRGFGFATSLQKELIKTPRTGLAGLKVGAEIGVDLGTVGTQFSGPNFWDIAATYGNVSYSDLWIKGSYYPIKKYLSGFYLSLGPTIGYKSEISSDRLEVTFDPNTGNYRKKITSILYEKKVNYGYKLGIGYDFKIAPSQFIVGVWTSFYNNNLGDINTSLGLKVGYNFNK